MESIKNKLFLIFFLFIIINISFAQKKDPVSFAERNKTSKYFSFSLGMGVNYCDNKSLRTFIEYELPDYNTVPDDQRLSPFFTGIEFFSGAEFQISKKFALKGEYSYFSKSYNSTYSLYYQNFNFSYYSHQPFLTLYYLIPQENSFIKIGAGAGFLASQFFEKTAYGNERSFSSTGLAFRLNAALDIQMGKNLAGYISVFANKTFQSDLKDSNGNLLVNIAGGSVNLNSLGVGVRVGVEYFFF